MVIDTGFAALPVGPNVALAICVPGAGTAVGILLIKISVIDGAPRLENGKTLARHWPEEAM